MQPENIKYFKTQADFRKWLERNHAKADFLWVGFHKKASGKKSITYHEALEEALSFGWIDGLRMPNDEYTHTIRFTPRRKGSIWSAINIKKMNELIEAGVVHSSGLKAFNERDPKKTNLYSSENRDAKLPAAFEKHFRANKKAWEWFQGKPNGYRKTAAWWVISAKQDQTRIKRLETLIEDSEAGRTIKPLTRKK
jgi:uncharacterized protein YdeI (YjbR/CyaY-like superfamily)